MIKSMCTHYGMDVEECLEIYVNMLAYYGKRSGLKYSIGKNTLSPLPMVYDNPWYMVIHCIIPLLAEFVFRSEFSR